MRYFFGMFSREGIRAAAKSHIFILKLSFNAGMIFVTSCTITEKENQEAESVTLALEYQAEGLNNVLPQRLDLNTTFDSVGLGTNQLNYYYTISDLSETEFRVRELYDSLYTEAVGRIPCTLWRPDYMQGVEVTFNYYSSDAKKLLHFARHQEGCCQ